MDTSTIITEIDLAAAAIGNPLAAKAAAVLTGLLKAIPAIQAGATSVETFLNAEIVLIESGGKVSDDQWTTQINAMTEATNALDKQVQEDNNG